jgi:large subunit ribosomal protein L24
MANKIRRDDEIIVLAGKDKGKQGKVLKVIPGSDRLIVVGVNLIKMHQKPNRQLGEEGGVIENEESIHVSNVAIYNAKAGKADRVGFRLEGEKKVRFFKSDGELI